MICWKGFGGHRVAHAAALRRFERFEQQRGEPLHADAADQFHRAGGARFVADDLHRHAVRRDHIAEARGFGAAGENGCLDAIERHRAHDGCVDECAATLEQRGDAFDGFDADGIGVDINMVVAEITFHRAQRRQRCFAWRHRDDEIGALAEFFRCRGDFNAVAGGEYAHRIPWGGGRRRAAVGDNVLEAGFDEIGGEALTGLAETKQAQS